MCLRPSVYRRQLQYLLCNVTVLSGGKSARCKHFMSVPGTKEVSLSTGCYYLHLISLFEEGIWPPAHFFLFLFFAKDTEAQKT